MPRLRETTEEKEMRRFNRFINGYLKEKRLRQEDLADYLELPRPSVGNRLCGKTKWTLADMAKACEFIGVPYTIGGER